MLKRRPTRCKLFTASNLSIARLRLGGLVFLVPSKRKLPITMLVTWAAAAEFTTRRVTFYERFPVSKWLKWSGTGAELVLTSSALCQRSFGDLPHDTLPVQDLLEFACEAL